MGRNSNSKHSLFTVVMIFSGILTAIFAYVLFYNMDSNKTDDKVIQAYENISQTVGEDMQVVLSLGEKPDTLTVSWKGNKTKPEYLRYGKTPGEAVEAEFMKARKTVSLKGRYCRCSVVLEDLSEGQEYYYEIGDGTHWKWSGTFVAPEQKLETTVMYMGDVQADVDSGGYEKWEKMTANSYGSYPELDFAVIGGDMVNNAESLKQWNGFFSGCSLFARLPLMTAAGNHEGAGSNNIYKKLFALPENGPGPKALNEGFYYFDYGYCRFIMLDSSFLTEERRIKLGMETWLQYENKIEDWIEKTLKKSHKTWNIIVVHHPPYGLHDYDTVSPEIRRMWTPIMEKEGVDLVLSGHQHMYMRTRKINGITYIMGNSGDRESEYYTGYNAPLYAEKIYGKSATYQIIIADSRELKIRCINEKGLVIDETSIEKELHFHIFELFSSYQVIV